jgi:hypothetical protein
MSRAREVSKVISTVQLVEDSIDNIGNIDLSSTINTASAAAVAYLIDGAPAALNTLNELAAALNDNESFATTVTNELSSKLSISSASATYLPQSSPAVGFKNKIINGSMRFWQRGTSFTTPAGAYTADRYKVTQNATSGTYVASRQTASLDGFQYCMRLQRSSGQTATGSLFLGHSLESNDVIPLQGKTLVFSFYAKKGSNFSSSLSDIIIQLATGTGTDGQPFAGLTNEVTQINATATLSTSWQRFNYTFTAPSTASELRFNINYTPTGTASTNDYFDITGIQLELGNILTDFEHKSFTDELRMCQRYFCSSFPIGITPNNNLGTSTSGGNDLTSYTPTVGNSYSSFKSFPVSMRRSPDMSLYNAENTTNGTWTTYNSSGALNATATPTSTSSTTRGFLVYFGGNTVTVTNGAWAANAEL